MKGNEMESRYKKLNPLNLQEVEQEIDTLLSIVDLDNLSDDNYELLNSLIKLAKALGSRREW